MKRFALAAVLGSMGRALAVVVALVALAGALYFGGHKFSNPDHYSPVGGGLCNRPFYGDVITRLPQPCSPPTRAAWQIPLAALLAAVALGAVVAAGADVRPRRRPLPRLTV
jgi:hypothetical protein